MNGSTVTASTNVKIAAELLHAGDHAWMPTPERNGLPTYVRCQSRSPVQFDGQAMRVGSRPMTGGQRVTPHPS